MTLPWRRDSSVETGRGPAAAATMTLPWRRDAERRRARLRYLSRVPLENERADDVDAALVRFAPGTPEAFRLADRPPGFVTAARTTAFLGAGLDAASGLSALKINSDLAAGASDASAAFRSPRLHGGSAEGFSIADVEVYALRPLW